jgi:hypothetical protein
MASTGCRMLTVSSRTKTDTSRPARAGMLTLDDARPLPRAQKERRGTPASCARLLAGAAECSFGRAMDSPPPDHWGARNGGYLKSSADNAW